MGTAADTDWSQILAVSPPSVVDLNRAVAVAELHGAAAALATLDDPHLADYHRFKSTRAELLRRLLRRWGRSRRG